MVRDAFLADGLASEGKPDYQTRKQVQGSESMASRLGHALRAQWRALSNEKGALAAVFDDNCQPSGANGKNIAHHCARPKRPGRACARLVASPRHAPAALVTCGEAVAAHLSEGAIGRPGLAVSSRGLFVLACFTEIQAPGELRGVEMGWASAQKRGGGGMNGGACAWRYALTTAPRPCSFFL